MHNSRRLAAILLLACPLGVQLTTLTMAAVAASPPKVLGGTRVNDHSGLEREVFAYFRDFGKADVTAILSHYADDAVFMPAGLPTVSGKENIRSAYVDTLKHVRIQPGGQSIAEDVLTFGEYAWVRTDSRATALDPTTGQKAAGHFREVFLLRKVGEKWKIWRYMFNMIDEPAGK